ncbi:selenocysteine-specific translation elongation factor [Chromobacterium sp.]|uniref:selenocysteine-specific translation elongation factor n=1 Tax=Chromobacterium sp. TaxID=306190 RepID=UPI0035B09E78
MIIATAGHVDHGKTSLLHALTGTDADRLPEEKKRGMTIDLGYAYLPTPEGGMVGFIDVPGHERFLGNMLAGVGGVRHALLVVAADDGVMPQTREHLAILQLLRLDSLTVAISKCDLADAEQLERVLAQTRQTLAAPGLPLAALFPVSAASGAGIDALRRHLLQLPSGDLGVERRFRLAIDRAFIIGGAGLVVTGTAWGGRVEVGDTLWLSGKEVPMRVRGLHVQNQPARQGQAGQRIALNLSGEAEKQDIQRGDWLLAAAPPAPAASVSVRLRLTAAPHAQLRHWQPVHIHHAASHCTGRIVLLEQAQLNPGDAGLAELALDRPLHLADGDRLILRDAGAQHTLAGAVVLERQPPTRGKRHAERLAYLCALDAAAGDDAGQLRLRLQRQALSLPELAWDRQLSETGLTRLLDAAPLQIAGQHAYAPEHWARLQLQLLERLQTLHLQQPDQLGASRGRMRRLALPLESEAAVNLMIDQLLASGKLLNTRGWLHLPEHVLAFTPQEAVLWQRLEPAFGTDGQACWVRDLAALGGVEEEEARALLRKAARLGHVHAVVPDRYFSGAAIRRMAAVVRDLNQQAGYADAANFRDQLGCGRKLAIQVLEYFDRSGFTRRLGDKHLLREAQLFD